MRKTHESKVEPTVDGKEVMEKIESIPELSHGEKVEESDVQLMNDGDDSVAEVVENVIEISARAVLGGKLYDTSLATKIFMFDEYPYNLEKYFNPKDLCTCGYCEIGIYKGNTEYFAGFDGHICRMTETSVKDLIFEHDQDKYKELFGEPEEA